MVRACDWTLVLRFFDQCLDSHLSITWALLEQGHCLFSSPSHTSTRQRSLLLKTSGNLNWAKEGDRRKRGRKGGRREGRKKGREEWREKWRGAWSVGTKIREGSRGTPENYEQPNVPCWGSRDFSSRQQVVMAGFLHRKLKLLQWNMHFREISFAVQNGVLLHSPDQKVWIRTG